MARNDTMVYAVGAIAVAVGLWYLLKKDTDGGGNGGGGEGVLNLGKPTVTIHPNPDPYIPTGIPDVTAIITNLTSGVVTRTVGIYCDYYAQNSSDLLYDDRYCYSEVVTLQPGQSYTMHWYDPGTGVQLYNNYADFFLMDDLGNRSAVTRGSY